MKYNIATLANGLRVIHLPNNSKIAYCGYQIKAGTRNEKPGEEGLAHFCEHVTFKGTQTHTSTAIINKLESVGGDLNAFTNKEDTVFYSAIPVEHFAKAVDVLSDIVFYSIFPQAEIDKEVEVICDEIEGYNDTPADLIYDQLEHLLFEGHALGHSTLGQPDTIRAYTHQQLMAFRQRLYQPERAVFFAYGDINFARLVRLLSKAHGCPMPELTAGGAVAVDALLPPPPFFAHLPMLPTYNPRHEAEDKDTHQCHVILGTRAYGLNHPRRMTLALVTNLLGGPGMSARLNLSLRERNALVYTVESFFITYSDTGVWGVYFGCDPHDVSRCRRLVRRELDRLMAAPLTSAQLRAAKQQMKGQVAVASDGHESYALDMAKLFLHQGRLKNVQRVLDAIDAITAADVQAVAQDLFAPEGLTEVVWH